MKRVGFVGLGVMGAPMAGHLVSAGHKVTIWNRTTVKCEPIATMGATVARSLEELGEDNDIICLCVGRTEDVEECLIGLTQFAKPNTLFIDHSTISPMGAIAIHANLTAKGLRFLDAPITGGSMRAQKGTLTIFCGGDAGDIEEAKPVLSAYGRTIAHVGAPGSGQMMKMANQIAVGGALLALCESLAFAKKAGLDLELTRDLLSGGAAGSWAFDNYGPKIVQSDWSPGFSIKNQRKDFAYCLEAAATLDAAIPGTLLIDSLLATLQEQGHGEWATAVLFDLLLESSAIK